MCIICIEEIMYRTGDTVDLGKGSDTEQSYTDTEECKDLRKPFPLCTHTFFDIVEWSAKCMVVLVNDTIFDSQKTFCIFGCHSEECGYFTPCSYPNPEIFEALKLGLELATKTGADLMLATDPDADRVGIAMKCPDGSYELVSGNEMGVLLLDYICAGRIEKGTMPANPVAVKSIVSTPLADAVAKHYGVEMRNVLTGFKWIGDQIANLEAAGEVDRFIFGFEESYGYLAGPYVRDKDAVIGSMLICEMAAYYRSIGSSIKQRLEEIYAQYGRYLNKVDSFEFPGLTGMEKMASIMQKLRDEPLTEIGGHKVVKIMDYKKPEETGLPAANVLIYTLENGATVVVRPSGTEPKIKTYFTTLGKTLEEAQAQKDALAAAIEPILK